MNRERLLSPSRAANKAASERKVFQGFLEAINWPLGTVTSEPPPAPDILYSPANGNPIAFELAEIVDESFVRALDHFTKSAHDGQNDEPESNNQLETPSFQDFQNPLQPLLHKKLHKTYISEHPIHLLLYWAGRSALFQEKDLHWLSHLCNSDATGGPFDAIWYWGAEGHPIEVWTKDCATQVMSR